MDTHTECYLFTVHVYIPFLTKQIKTFMLTGIFPKIFPFFIPDTA